MTKFGYLTNSELLSMLHLKRQQSPIIEELCSRLESHHDCVPFDDYSGTENRVSCPTCESALLVDHCEDENLFNLTVYNETV